MDRYVTKAELGRMGQCSYQLITQNSAPGKKFHGALTADGKMDLDHPEVKKWLEQRKDVISPSKITSKQFDRLTIKQVTDHYSNVEKLEGYIKVRKMIVETEHKQIQMEASRELLVSREFVAKVCFGIIGAALIKLLDMPRGMVDEISAILDTGVLGSKEECEQLLTKEISLILQNAKDEVSEKLSVEMLKVSEDEVKDEVSV